MQVIREKQKLIYWIVAITVIPTMILLFGGGSDFFRSQQGNNMIVARVGGEDVDYASYVAFRKRMAAVCPINLMDFNASYRGPTYYIPNYKQGSYTPARLQADSKGHHYSAVFAMSHLHEAEKAGVIVTDAEVDTFIRSKLDPGSSIKDDEEFQKTYKRMLEMYQISSGEFRRGAREWLTLLKFIELIDGTALATPQTAYYASLRNAIKYTSVRVSVAANDYREQVEKKLQELSDEARDSRIRTYYEDHAETDRDFWTEPQFCIEYVFAPFKVEGAELPVDEDEMKAYYEKNRARFIKKTPEKEEKAEKKTAEDAKKDEKKEPEYKPFEEVKDEIHTTLLDQKQRRFARNTINMLDSFFADQLKKNSDTKLVPLDAIRNYERLTKKRGVIVGDTGKAPLEGKDMMKLPVIGGSPMLAMMLNQIDREMRYLKEAAETASTKEDKKSTKKELEAATERNRNSFQGIRMMQANEEPFSTEEGLFLIRLSNYTPGTKMPLKGKDGKIDPAIRTKIIEALANDDCDTMARERADEIKAQLQEGKFPSVSAEESKETTLPFAQIPRKLQNTRVGVAYVESSRGMPGYDVIYLKDRTVPETTSVETLTPEQVAITTHRLRGQGRYDPLDRQTTNFLSAIIMGPRLMEWINNEMDAGRLAILKPLQPTE